MARLRISLCMIVKNEEANLPTCLRASADLVDEIVVVDTGSTDATREIAVRFGARLFDFPWVDSFAAARNESLRHATGDWIFWLDADDSIDETNRARLRALFAGLKDEHVCYTMGYASVVRGRVTNATMYPRLFRNRPDVRWRYRAHNDIEGAVRRSGGAVRPTDVVIHTTGYGDPAAVRRKLERTYRLLQMQLPEHPGDPYPLFHLGRASLARGKTAEGVAALRQALGFSTPADPWLCPIHCQLVRGLHQLGLREEALAVCGRGLSLFPEEVELLFRESLIRAEMGDLGGAADCLRRLLQFGQMRATTDVELRGCKGRHNLGMLYQRQGREAEAEREWLQGLAERPDYEPTCVALGELYLRQGRRAELERLLSRMEAWAMPSAAGLRDRSRGPATP